MATGGFRSNTTTGTTDFLEEWKAKREKMRAKMLGDIAAASSGCAVNVSAPGTSNRNPEVNNNGGSSSSSANCAPANAVVRSSSSSALRRPEDDPHQGSAPRCADPLKKVPSTSQLEGNGNLCGDNEKESPAPAVGSGKGKEKRSTGPSARKGKGQIEKRKLREKRRSTGVVSIPSNESLDELDDDEGGEKERKTEEELTQHNTVQNEAMIADTGAAHFFQETPRGVTGRYRSEEESGGNSRHRQGHSRQGKDTSGTGSMERRVEELEKELAIERQENMLLLSANKDKDELIGKLKEEIDLLNRDLDDLEDENEQLKQENKTLLKVVGQLTR
ncbi:PRKC apoptosis WT1 regulator protein [Scleropages formosus]|uniref:Pro-apoptotic WT1 regulator n=1 Tax=Scleropages formosus TaxID=113540 RepID=A0A8C9TKU0_SCLFO|nr:PRKC apoptosis WT1 regulator protein [Scleropages formosus]